VRSVRQAGDRARRRRLGQHFLSDGNVARRIVAAAEMEGRPPIVEIGPGRGALSILLREMTDHLYLVEIDPELAEGLRVRYADDPAVVIAEADVLACDVPRLVAEPAMRVVGNLPYSVASQILLRLIEWRERCPLAVVMLQEEVARRVVAKPDARDYGVLTLLVQLYADVELCFTVSRHCFSPRPQVESAVVRLRLQTSPRVPVVDPALFRVVVRSLFQHRRKMVRNTVGAALTSVGANPDDALDVLRAAGLDPTLRPENLGLRDFAELTRAVAACRPGSG
jgi:16S rRNA (adenine1518-N6/adenine1519-N6)-dimethyltransferase